MRILPAGAGAIALLCLALQPPGLEAQSSGQEGEVLDVVETLFHAMAERDADLVAEILLPDGQFVVVRVEADGSVRTAITPHQDFVSLIASADRPIIERFWDPEIRVHGPLATVWTPYDLFRGDEFSHCGVDAFTLVRTGDGWRISGGSYTIEPYDCPPSPEGPMRPGRVGPSQGGRPGMPGT